jgi:hypothetical protein
MVFNLEAKIGISNYIGLLNIYFNEIEEIK